MAPESPKVALSSDWGSRLGRDDIFWRIATGGVGITRLIENEVDLCEAEACQLDLEVEIDQALQLDRENFLIPAGVERELVVGKDVGSTLCL